LILFLFACGLFQAIKKQEGPKQARMPGQMPGKNMQRAFAIVNRQYQLMQATKNPRRTAESKKQWECRQK